jgi:hypothetical protein
MSRISVHPGLSGSRVARRSGFVVAAGLRAGLVALVVTALAACGGSDGDSALATPPPAAAPAAATPQTVQGPDGASLAFVPADGSAAVTLRIARDGTGAPALPDDRSAAGAIYQYTPHGHPGSEVEITVPFDSARLGGAEPRLLLALAGDGGWMDVEARREGGVLRARVPALGYAVVVGGLQTESQNGSPVRKASAPGAPTATFLRGSVTADPPLQGDGRVRTVLSPSQVTLQFEHSFARSCANPVQLRLRALVVPAAQPRVLRIVDLGSRSLTTATGNSSFTLPLSVADNGTWIFLADALCVENRRLRFGVLATVPTLLVKITDTEPVPLPVIAQQPQAASVIEGDPASFSASATGATRLQWERSGDGGASYLALAGQQGSTLTLPVTTLADHNALFRLRAGNVTGEVVSSPALLSVAERLIPPVVTLDPVGITVTEGETASFSAAASGKPLPTIQWQQRSASNEPWADVPGATQGTYTTAPSTLAMSGLQLRALFSSRAGQAGSQVAPLTVRPRIVAPVITLVSGSSELVAGTCGYFDVQATGTAPLNYSWGSTGGAVYDYGSYAFVCVDAADVGRRFAVTVTVANAAGARQSVVEFNVVANGALIDAATGGTVLDRIGGQAKLDVPPGALAQSTFISVDVLSRSSVQLPEGYTAISDAVRIGPSGLAFTAGNLPTLTIPWDGEANVGPAEPGTYRAVALIRDATTVSGATRVQRAGAGVRSKPMLASRANPQRIGAGSRVVAQRSVELPDGQVAEFQCPPWQFSATQFLISGTTNVSGTFVVVQTGIDPCLAVNLPDLQLLGGPQAAQWAAPSVEQLQAGGDVPLPVFDVPFRNGLNAIVDWQRLLPGSNTWETVSSVVYPPLSVAQDVRIARLVYPGPLSTGSHNVRARLANLSNLGVETNVQFTPIAGFIITGTDGTVPGFSAPQEVLGFNKYGVVGVGAPIVSQTFGSYWGGGFPEFSFDRKLGQLVNAGTFISNIVGSPKVARISLMEVAVFPVNSETSCAAGEANTLSALASVIDSESPNVSKSAASSIALGRCVSLTRLTYGVAGQDVQNGVGRFVYAWAADGDLKFGTVNVTSGPTRNDISVAMAPGDAVDSSACPGDKRIDAMASPEMNYAFFGGSPQTRAALVMQGLDGLKPANSTCVGLLRNGAWAIEKLWDNRFNDAVVLVSNAGVVPLVSQPTLAINSRGEVLVAGVVRVQENSGASITDDVYMRTAVRGDASAWQFSRWPVAINPPLTSQPDAVFDSQGIATLLWLAPQPGTPQPGTPQPNVVFAARGTVAGWNPAQMISPAGIEATFPQVSVTSFGEVRALYGLNSAAGRIVAVQRYSPGGAWRNSTGQALFDMLTPNLGFDPRFAITQKYLGGEGGPAGSPSPGRFPAVIYWRETDPLRPATHLRLRKATLFD